MIKVKLDKTKLKFQKLNENYLDEILKIQDDTFKSIEDPSILRRNTKETFYNCLSNHFTLGVFYQQELIAFGILYFGRKTSENIGYDLDIDKYLLESVANVKLIIVKDKFRGNSLQTIIINKLEEVAKQNNIKILGATVSPNNIHSIRNFTNLGFAFYKQKIKYDGLIRNIYYKSI